MVLSFKRIGILLVLAIFNFTVRGNAQSVSGNWYGIGEVDLYGVHNSYLSELILKQKGNKITGEFNYFFRDEILKSKVTGTYSPKTRLLTLNAFPLLNYQATNKNGADCPMIGYFTLKVSRAESSLTGMFEPIDKYQYTCPTISSTLKKEIYVKPAPAPAKRPDAGQMIATKEKVQPAPVIVESPVVTALQQRAFEESPVIEIGADSLRIAFYDNGEIDNDTISIFYNRALIGEKKMLSLEPLSFTLPVDTSINEIAMFAENMGSIPPNSAVAIIYVDGKRYELFLSSTYIKNATIRFRKKKINTDPKNIN